MNQLIIKPWMYKVFPVVIWVLVLIMPFLNNPPGNIPKEVHRDFLVHIFISNFILLCIFYIHTYWSYPLLMDGKILWYMLLIGVVLGAYWLYWTLFPFQPPHPHDANITGNRHDEGDPHNFIPVVSPFIAILCSFCYRVIVDNSSREQLIKERETIHLRTELNFLRSQISPHFMFNVLNNLVALARKKSDSLEPAIVNLSQLMRYMLYESDDNRVPLAKEIAYLKNYIDLQLLRFGDAVKVSMNITGDTEQLSIEPMLLIPFVENAFKHGTGMLDEPVIVIALDIDTVKPMIKFRVINAVSRMDTSKDAGSGIGLANVKRRLAILYPNKHELNVTDKQDVFTAALTIYLS